MRDLMFLVLGGGVGDDYVLSLTRHRLSHGKVM